MRIFIIAVASLSFTFSSASATVGFSCNAADKSIKLGIDGAYGTGLGSTLANFRGDAGILLPGIPDDVRKLQFDSSHVRQNWFVGRTLNIMMVWQLDEPYREVTLFIETRRGRKEESPYLGRYTLSINVAPVEPATEGKRYETTGTVSCGIG
jgi:hypothetical protein